MKEYFVIKTNSSTKQQIIPIFGLSYFNFCIAQPFIVAKIKCKLKPVIINFYPKENEK